MLASRCAFGVFDDEDLVLMFVCRRSMGPSNWLRLLLLLLPPRAPPLLSTRLSCSFGVVGLPWLFRSSSSSLSLLARASTGDKSWKPAIRIGCELKKISLNFGTWEFQPITNTIVSDSKTAVATHQSLLLHHVQVVEPDFRFSSYNKPI